MKKWTKKLWSAFMAMMLLMSSLGMQGHIYAGERTSLVLTSSQDMGFEDGEIKYFSADDGNPVGVVRVTRGGANLTFEQYGDMDNRVTCEQELNMGDIVSFDLRPVEGYQAPTGYTYNDTHYTLEGESATNFEIIINTGENVLSFDFVASSSGNEGGGETPAAPPMPPMQEYPLTAYFMEEDSENGEIPEENIVPMEEGKITIPANWNSGTVFFTAEITTSEEETIKEPVAIEGIANLDEINNTASINPFEGSGVGGEDRQPGKSVTITEGFSEYGKLQLHIVKVPGGTHEINQLLNIEHNNLINIKADAPLAISQSFGTVAMNQAIITKDETKDVKIFFGNTTTKLVLSGNKVVGITAVTGSTLKNVSIDGKEATVTLPGLSRQTTTPVKITIAKTDGTTISRNINIVRTAIQLQHNYGGGDDTVYAGYVVNKGYLYNNQDHNDDVFNAYLQVVLYKDNAVAGYKQIKIDDEELIKGLNADESGSLELYSEKQIKVYGKEAGGLIDGVNKVSVFLTNGPIDFNSETLPSIEFGIGSGVTCEWGELS